MTPAQWTEAERTVRWIVWPGALVYGPGLTASEAAERGNNHMRSGWWRGSSSAYHNIRVAPETLPEDTAWRQAYPSLRAGIDPWDPYMTGQKAKAAALLREIVEE